MGADVYQLSLLLTLKDAASGGLDRFQARLLAAGKDSEKYVKSLENMRSEMNKGIAMTGIGTAGLALMGKGVLIAGDFQAAMTELRASFSKVGADGKVNMAALSGDMQRAEAVAMKLGNELPGTSQDFISMMQALKQNGLGIDTILNGAAEAVANLAVATNSVPREIAADFAKFGNLFKLRAEDFEPAADVFARIYSSTGQTSQDLVQAARYFQGRAGASLGISGLKDAEQMTRLFGLMGKNGMTGDMAGQGLTQFFESYGQHKDKLDDLQKATGIKLDFFDEDKKFVGMESVIEQMQQFNQLSTEDRTAWMSEMFGVLGMGAGNILANGEAWKKHNSEVDQAISLAQKKTEISKNFNNQLEALTGSVKNLVVTGFTPLLPALTSGAESANKMVSAIIDFAKANPTLTSTVAKLALLGTTATVLVGSIKALYNAFGLMRFAANFTSDQRVTGFLKKLKENADAATPAIENSSKTIATSVASGADVYSQAATRTEAASKKATKELTAKQQALRALRGPTAEATSGFKAYAAADKALGVSVASTGRQLVDTEQKIGKLRGAYQGLAGSGAVRLGVQIGVVMAAEAAVVSFVEHIMTGKDLEAKVRLNMADIKAQYDSLLLSGELFRPPGFQSPAIDASVQPGLNTILDGGRLMRMLHPERTSPDDSYFKQLTGANFWEDIVSSPVYGTSPTGNKGFMNSTEMINFNPRVFAKRLQDGGIGQYGRDPNQLAALLQSVKSIPGATVTDVDKITEAIKLAVGDPQLGGVYGDNLAKALELVAAREGRDKSAPSKPYDFSRAPVAPTLRDIRTPLNLQPFNPFNQSGFQFQKKDEIAKSAYTPDGRLQMFDLVNRRQTLSPPQKPSVTPESQLKTFDFMKSLPAAPPLPPLDIKKLIDTNGTKEALNALNQPVATNVTNFTSLNPATATSVTNITNLAGPTQEAAQALQSLVPPANQMPGSFSRINTSVGNVAGALDGLSVSIASWRPPATPGIAATGADGKPVPATPFAVGGQVSGSGLAYVHANEQIVPARATAFRDTLGQNLVSSLTNIRNNRTDANQSHLQSINDIRNNNSAGGITPTMSLSTIGGNDRYRPRPDATGPFPQLAATAPTSNVTGGQMGRVELLRDLRQESKSEGQRPASQSPPVINVTIQQGEITINMQGGSSEEVAKIKKMLSEHQTQAGQIAVEAVRREMARGRQRA